MSSDRNDYIAILWSIRDEADLLADWAHQKLYGTARLPDGLDPEDTDICAALARLAKLRQCERAWREGQHAPTGEGR
jgi:hypothetical protein